MLIATGTPAQAWTAPPDGAGRLAKTQSDLLVTLS